MAQPETTEDETPLPKATKMLLRRAAKLIDPNRKDTENDRQT
ncbi:hypothetical protein [Celeribacter naphthalenivorans]|nr:hypothetical protein [Celeribacter naphthalenivorans]